ncbi:hypothetical protein [Halomonas daqiaonensis]|uniref:Uncharacterized protein n=1 Tax=Halomonas daqiaonensis TaxID=650850 RepID=A0A1H7LZ04_9GAMM|nr:hypothetical protein [Halomonas daqiaonensis]SEL04112.1 hypothetical protein SAMN04488129_10696 [Halomonas daqiaonensis]
MEEQVMAANPQTAEADLAGSHLTGDIVSKPHGGLIHVLGKLPSIG